MFRIILFIIAIYIAAKVIGVALQFIRLLSGQGQAKQPPVGQPRTGRGKIPYTNVEDVDYEDLTDKKDKE